MDGDRYGHLGWHAEVPVLILPLLTAGLQHPGPIHF